MSHLVSTVRTMKILHTSDWHVGKGIRGRSRADEHQDVLAEIVGIAEDRAVDLVLVTGDAFDTASPTPDAERIVYRALLGLAATGAQVIVLAGNHDNPRRWQAIRPLLDLGNVHVAWDVRRPDDGGVVDVTTRAGEVARVALVPFLSKRDIVRSEQLMSRRADQHEQRYADRAGRIIAALTEGFGPDTVNIVAAHLTVASGQPVMGGGERTVHSILDYVLPPQVFPSTAQYVALGHLHQPHRIPGPCPIWYCGSPLALDFGEVETTHKAVLVVDAEPGLPARVEEVRLVSGRRLRTVRGSVEELRARDDLDDAHLRVVVTEPERAGLADEVRAALPNAVDVRVHRDDEDEASVEVDFDLEDLTRSPVELFGEYLAEERIEDERLSALFNELLEDVHAAHQA